MPPTRLSFFRLLGAATLISTGSAAAGPLKPLDHALQTQAEASAERLPDEAKRVMDEALTDLAKSDIGRRALPVGAPAPAFQLPDSTGRLVSSKQLLEHGPVVLVFYRGAWCPYCNLTVAAYEAARDEIEAAGATLVAISPEKPPAAKAMAEKEALGFPVLTDTDNAYARRLGIVYSLPPGLVGLYQEFGIPLERKAGSSDTYELPLSATYVVDSAGIIRFAFLDPDYRKRAEPADVMAVLRQLQAAP